jgi:hypothetical protein
VVGEPVFVRLAYRLWCRSRGQNNPIIEPDRVGNFSSGPP